MKTTTFSLTKISPEATIETTSGFKSLNIEAAYTQGKSETAYMPFIKIVLQNSKYHFNFHGNEIRDSNSFDCFDILESARLIEPLKNEIFTKLKIDATESMSFDETIIKLKIEFED